MKSGAMSLYAAGVRISEVVVSPSRAEELAAGVLPFTEIILRHGIREPGGDVEVLLRARLGAVGVSIAPLLVHGERQRDARPE